MRILTYDYEYPPVGGGGGIAHEFLASELAREDEVVVVTSAYGDLPAREVRDGVEIHRVPVWARTDRTVASLRSMLSFPPAAWTHALRHLRGRSFDVVNSHFAVPTGLGSLPIARHLAIPHVQTIHGGDIYDPSKRISPHRLPGVRRCVRWVLRTSDAVVAQSSDTRANALNLYDERLDVRIVPLAIRVPEVPAASRSELGLPPDGFLAVTVGRVVGRKGLDRLIAALARPECEDIQLAVVGKGPELGSLKALADRLGMAHRVTFTGWVSDTTKWQILRTSDAYLSATLHEGYGLVFLEAMAAGLPVVTPDHGGHLDFLEDGVTGFVVPAGDEVALAAATARIASGPALRRRIGDENLERSHDHRLDAMAEQYRTLFREVVEARGAAARTGAGQGSG